MCIRDREIAEYIPADFAKAASESLEVAKTEYWPLISQVSEFKSILALSLIHIFLIICVIDVLVRNRMCRRAVSINDAVVPKLKASGQRALCTAVGIACTVEPLYPFADTDGDAQIQRIVDGGMDVCRNGL